MFTAANPTVSIILPTYNRATFLPEAFAAIHAQTFRHWELIVVDDGSTDGTRELVPRLTREFPQPVRYIYQENQGAYGARNTGLDNATGKYIAFYDSDDLWLPHHLKNCAESLEANPNIDWVYGACRIVNNATGEELAPSTFYVNSKPRPFLRLKTRDAGKLRIIEDDRVLECMISHGTYNGLQNSVLRREIFDGVRFEAESRNEAEDQLFVISSLRRGFRLAYIDAVHVEYRIHDANSCAAGSANNEERQRRVLQLLVRGYERLLSETDWQSYEHRAIRRRLMQDYFWKIGYATLWMRGQRAEALQMFRRGLHYWPWDWRCWRTYLPKRLFSRI
jgi:glycosyltransferase involved in cell wall biosynthesis